MAIGALAAMSCTGMVTVKSGHRPRHNVITRIVDSVPEFRVPDLDPLPEPGGQGKSGTGRKGNGPNRTVFDL